MGDKKAKKISDLPGIGPAAEEKLKEGGFTTIESIAVASARDLVALAGLGEATAIKAINMARNSLEMGFETADLVLEKRKSILNFIKRGSSKLSFNLPL